MGVVDSYAAAVVRFPCVFFFGSLFFALGLGGLAYGVKESARPEFDKASKGFESRGGAIEVLSMHVRLCHVVGTGSHEHAHPPALPCAAGTELAGRIFTWTRSVEKSQCQGKLSALPNVTTFHTFARYPDENKPYPTCPFSGFTELPAFSACTATKPPCPLGPSLRVARPRHRNRSLARSLAVTHHHSLGAPPELTPLAWCRRSWATGQHLPLRQQWPLRRGARRPCGYKWRAWPNAVRSWDGLHRLRQVS